MPSQNRFLGPTTKGKKKKKKKKKRAPLVDGSDVAVEEALGRKGPAEEHGEAGEETEEETDNVSQRLGGGSTMQRGEGSTYSRACFPTRLNSLP